MGTFARWAMLGRTLVTIEHPPRGFDRGVSHALLQGKIVAERSRWELGFSSLGIAQAREAIVVGGAELRVVGRELERLRQLRYLLVQCCDRFIPRSGRAEIGLRVIPSLLLT